MSLQVLVILVPVLFGLMGFAVDLGRLYMVRSELKTAANAMAVAAAQQLIGTELAVENATAAARRTLETETGFGNRYDFGGLPIGESTGTLASEVPDPTFYETAVDAIGEESSAGGGEASGPTARYVRVTVNADAPLIFWALLAQGLERKTPIFAEAAAGVSAPLCQACGVEPIAVAALDADDEQHYGFVPNTKYTLGFICNGGPIPGVLAGTTQRIPYVIINRLNEEATLFPDEGSQLYRVGALGLPGSANPALSCLTVNTEEQGWATATPINCNQNRVVSQVTSFVCGIASRLETTVPAACADVPEADAISSATVPDLDVADLDDYTAYTGNLRRVITVAVVAPPLTTATLQILGFRQFLIEPVSGGATINPADLNGRFPALYIGSAVPLKQGRFDGCQLAAGPGKVVLHK